MEVVATTAASGVLGLVVVLVVVVLRVRAMCATSVRAPVTGRVTAPT